MRSKVQARSEVRGQIAQVGIRTTHITGVFAFHLCNLTFDL